MTTDIQGSNSFVGHLQLLVPTAKVSSTGAEAGCHNLLYSNALAVQQVSCRTKLYAKADPETCCIPALPSHPTAMGSATGVV